MRFAICRHYWPRGNGIKLMNGESRRPVSCFGNLVRHLMDTLLKLYE